MNITKKTIIIIAVVAVVAYLLWRKMKGGGSTVVEDLSLTAEPDKTSLNYILTHVDFTSAERNKIEALRKAAEASEMTYQRILAKANTNGRSYDQQLVLDAIWLLYTDNGEWTSSRGWPLCQQVLSL